MRQLTCLCPYRQLLIRLIRADCSQEPFAENLWRGRGDLMRQLTCLRPYRQLLPQRSSNEGVSRAKLRGSLRAELWKGRRRW